LPLIKSEKSILNVVSGGISGAGSLSFLQPELIKSRDKLKKNNVLKCRFLSVYFNNISFYNKS